MATIDEIQARREARKAARAKQHEEQFAVDLEALDKLEELHGDQALAQVKIDPGRWEPGLPTLVVVRVPESAFARFRTMIRKAKNNGEAGGQASDMLGDVSVAYPDADTYRAMRAKYEGLHDKVAIAAVSLAEGKTAEEGKG